MASDQRDTILRDSAAFRDVYALAEGLRGRLKAHVAAGDVAGIDALMAPLHAADIADLLEQVSEGERAAWLALWSRGIDGEVLSELDWGLREEVIALLPDEVLADAVRDLDSDDVVDLVEDLEDAQIEAILEVLEPADRVAVEQALSYPEESAGRLMQRAQDSDVKQRLMSVTEEAARRGAFGSPTFFIGDDIYFGKNTLGEIEERLAA
jgi:magnesium transporter